MHAFGNAFWVQKNEFGVTEYGPKYHFHKIQPFWGDPSVPPFQVKARSSVAPIPRNRRPLPAPLRQWHGKQNTDVKVPAIEAYMRYVRQGNWIEIDAQRHPLLADLPAARADHW